MLHRCINELDFYPLSLNQRRQSHEWVATPTPSPFHLSLSHLPIPAHGADEAMVRKGWKYAVFSFTHDTHSAQTSPSELSAMTLVEGWLVVAVGSCPWPPHV